MSKVCPICGCSYDDYPAISRIDNETEICPTCGMKEAINEFLSSQNEEDASGD